MVLWEITLATAYWLGIRKTYRLALKLQRRLISPRHARIREFTHRRVRNVFDIALRVHKGIQSRDLSAGRSVGNFILRFLDRARPSAKIRGPPVAGQKKLPAGGSSGDKGTLIGETKPKLGSHNRLLFSQFVHRAPFGQTMSSRMSMGIGRMCPSIQDTSPYYSGIRPYSTTGIAGRTLESVFSSPRVCSSFEKGVFREDIVQLMGTKPVWKSRVM